MISRCFRPASANWRNAWIRRARPGFQRRVRRGRALDEHDARTEQHVHLARDALLRRDEERLDVAAHRVEVLASLPLTPVGRPGKRRRGRATGADEPGG